MLGSGRVEEGDGVLETDDLIVITVIVVRYERGECRYTVQIGRLGWMIRNSVESIQLQKEMKDIDLNAPPVCTSKTATQAEDHGSQLFRNKMMDYVMGDKQDEIGGEDPTMVHKPLREDV